MFRGCTGHLLHRAVCGEKHKIQKSVVPTAVQEKRQRRTRRASALRVLRELLLAKVCSAATATVGRTEWVSGIAMAADQHVLVVFTGQVDECGLHDTAKETGNKVQHRCISDGTVFKSLCLI